MTPVAWNARDRTTKQMKRLLIRATPIAQLVYTINRFSKGPFFAMFLENGNTHETALAMIRELRYRMLDGVFVGAYTIMRMNSYDPPACACGRPGVRIVGTTTYCDAAPCMLRALQRRKAYDSKLDARAAGREQAIKEREQAQRSSEVHHKAVGMRRRARK